MTAPIDMSTRILQEIRDRVVDLARDTSRRFDQMDTRFEGVDQRLDALETLAVRHDQRLGAVETAVGGLSAQVRMLAAGVTASLEFRGQVEQRLDALERGG